MNQQPIETHPQVIDVRTVQIIIGVIAIGLPIILPAIKALLGQEDVFMDSISHYYHSRSRVAFTGSVCAIAMFFFTYRGYDDITCKISDDWLATLTGVCALGAAIFPTSIGCHPTSLAKSYSIVHFASSAIFLLLLAYMSAYRFTKSATYSKEEIASLEKLKPKKYRNRIYRICSAIIILMIVAIAVHQYLDGPIRIFTYLCETITFWAFGCSWLTKANLIFPDKK